jgi:hypothetical protein
MYTKFKVGQKCKCLHPYAFRGEAVFVITRIIPKFKAPGGKVRAVYEVQYADAKTDFIPIRNEGGYEMVCVDSEAKPEGEVKE